MLSAVGILLLAGCVQGSAAIGDPIEIAVSDGNSGTSATIAVTVDSVESVGLEVFEDEGLSLDDEYDGFTPYFVEFTVDLVDGTWGETYTYPFSQYQWTAYDASGEQATFITVMGAFEPCDGFSSDDAETLGSAGSFSGCQVFVAPSGDGLRDVRMDDRRWNVAD
jgi:hypothetical protein